MTKVDAVSAEVEAIRAMVAPVNDLALGGAHMRGMGKTYLPQFPLEDNNTYDARKDSTWLFDGVGKAVEDYTSRVFDKPVTCIDEGRLGDWCQNIDLEGRDLSNFAQDVFADQIKSAITFIMADAPRRDGEVTVGQAEAQNLRPYLLHFTIFEALGWKVGNINNAPTITQFRLMESVDSGKGDEFTAEMVDQVRVLDLVGGRVNVRLFRRGETGKKDWVVHEEYLTDQTEIMIVPVYSGRTGFLKARPPLGRLAEINLAHWRSQSDQANIMHHARAPIKVFMGWDKADLSGSAESPGYAFVTSNDNAKVDVIEHGGSALEAGRNELKDLEQQMQWTGLQLVMSKSSGATATGDAIDEKKNTSSLARWADNLKDSIEIALGWMLDLGATEGSAEVAMSRDYLSISLNEVSLETLQKLGFSQETLFTEAKRRGGVSDDLVVADELERVQREGALSLGVMGDG